MKKVSKNKKQYEGAKIYTSLHHKFLIEFRHLISTIPNYHFLDKDEIETAIANAMVYFIKGCERKGIDTSKFSNYKNYQFIILKNEVKKANVSRMNNTKTARREHLSLDEVDVFSNDEIEQYDYLQAIRDILDDEEYYVATELINGFDQKDITKDYDNSKFKVAKIVERIRKKIFPDMKFRMRQFETKTDVHNTKRQPYVKPIVEYDLPDFYNE